MSLIGSVRNSAPGDDETEPARTIRVPMVVGLLRFAAAAAIALLIAVALWLRRPTQLSPHTNIVGYPTYYDFVFTPNFLAYRLVVWELPIVTAVSYALLCWRGPLRRPAREATERSVLKAEEAEVGRHPLARLMIVLPPAALLAVAVSARRPVLGGTVTTSGIVSAIVYVVVVLIFAGAVAALTARRGVGGEPLELVNAVGCVLTAIGGVGFVAAHAWVQADDGRRQYWRFLPVWSVVLALCVGLAWMAWRLRVGWSAARIERRLRRLLVGSAFVFLATSAMPGAVGALQGFDDMQSVTGAGLLSRGYFPWRDFLFIHGLFEDALRSSLGFVLFQHTVWGSIAGSALVVIPLCWVGLYLLGAWSSRRGGFIGLLVLAFAVWNGVSAAAFFRFVALPFVFVLLGEALRHRDCRWTVALACAVFVDGLLVPESSFQAMAIILVIVSSDVLHRDPEARWPVALTRSLTFLGAGVVLSATWAVFLALNHALGPFLRYYLIFGPGHDAAGAVPKSIPPGVYPKMFYLTITLVVLTLAVAAWRLIGRRSWTARDWVTLAAAITAGLYQEKALGRFDLPHLLQTVGVALSLWILWAAALLDAADGLVAAAARRISRLRPTLPLLTRVASVVAVLIVLEQVPAVPRLLWHVPQNDKQRVTSLDDVPRIGYSAFNVADPALLPDLTKVLDTYAGPKGTIFDNTNSLGYYYYLLGRTPASALIHVSMAEPEYAQQLLVDQLRKSRPPVVVFDDDAIGLPSWDGPRNNVRHFEVAQYLLDGWTPVLRSHTALFMLRNDLVASKPAPPTLSAPPLSSNLYFSNASCDWGDTPNFLDSHPAGQPLALSVKPEGQVRVISLSGWAYDVARDRPVEHVVVATGGVIVGQVDVGLSRPDVVTASGKQGSATSGFNGTVSTTHIGGIRIYAELADGTAVPLHGTGKISAKQLTTATGGHVPVAAVPAGGVGFLETSGAATYRLSTAVVPPGTTLSSYQLAMFGAGKPIGVGSILLADNLAVQGGSSFSQHLITANTIADTGSTLPVRVGSCLQWHGYHTSTLYILQNKGEPITSLRLSAVKD